MTTAAAALEPAAPESGGGFPERAGDLDLTTTFLLYEREKGEREANVILSP